MMACDMFSVDIWPMMCEILTSRLIKVQGTSVYGEIKRTLYPETISLAWKMGACIMSVNIFFLSFLVDIKDYQKLQLSNMPNPEDFTRCHKDPRGRRYMVNLVGFDSLFKQIKLNYVLLVIIFLNSHSMYSRFRGNAT